jgi:O-methyltransferase
MIKRAVQSAIRKLGYDVVRHNNDRQCRFSADFEKRHIEIIERVSPYTITSHARIHALIESTRYILQNDIKGELVECGVYKGGSMMAIALSLMAEGVKDRDLYLFDTFEGMPAPEERDIDLWGKPALETFSQKKISDVSSTWVNSSLENVEKAIALTGYPMERIHFVKGLVENTIPEKAPESIALLRLDTDWYKSTIHELVHLFPRLSPKGVAIVDDYGHFKGAREAVDEFFCKNKMSPFLHRIDYTGRLIIKGE